MSDLGNDTTVCPNCQEEVGVDATTCPTCGEDLVSPVSQPSGVHSFSVAVSDDQGLDPVGDPEPPPFSGIEGETDPSSPAHFEELGDTDPSTGTEEQERSRTLMKVGAAVLVVAALGILGVGGWLLFSARSADAESELAPTSALPMTTATSTPLSAVQPTAVPTMAPVQVEVEGPGSFPEASYPYKAIYDVRLKRGQSMTATLECESCLMADATKTTGPLQRGSETSFQVVVPPLQEVDLALYVAGEECTAWKLSPSSEEAELALACTPELVK